MRSKSLVVMSAVNLVEGGTLSVAREVFAAADKHTDIHVVGLVNSKLLFPAYRRVKLIEVQNPKKSWLCRLYFELVSSWFLSRRLNPDTWLALHDITPRVIACRQYVYCHNPTPLYRAGLRDLLYQPTVFLFSLFYRHLYRLNISANRAVFVQQNHIRDYFLSNYPVEQVVVARPASAKAVEPYTVNNKGGCQTGLLRLFYPTLPRSFKNIELLIESAELLECRGVSGFEIRITISKEDGLYARYLAWRARKLKTIRLIGRLTREQVEIQYQQCNALVFPSKLETWGLPLTEAKSHGLPILAADLPYAKETLGQYEPVAFFEPSNAGQLADQIEQLSLGALGFSGSYFEQPLDTPVLEGWDELLSYIVDGGDKR